MLTVIVNRVCLLSGLLNVGGLEVLLVVSPVGSSCGPRHQPPHDELLLFSLLHLILELCRGASSLGYQAFSLLRLWCQRLQVRF